MDPTFHSKLIESEVGKDVLNILKQQKVSSQHILRAMKEKHIVRLLKCSGMPIGEHALLWELWEEYGATACFARK